jgi:uncharacterized protein YbbC (DUF1343 family)
LECPGVTATPIYFTPSTSKHQGEVCGGIHLHILDENALEPVALGVKLLDLLRRMYPNDFRLLEPDGEWKIPFLSHLVGHRDFENPSWNMEEIISRCARESREFRLRKAEYEIYPKEN